MYPEQHTIPEKVRGEGCVALIETHTGFGCAAHHLPNASILILLIFYVFLLPFTVTIEFDQADFRVPCVKGNRGDWFMEFHAKLQRKPLNSLFDFTSQIFHSFFFASS